LDRNQLSSNYFPIFTVAVQLLPFGTSKAYACVDGVKSLMEKLGLKYRVCPFVTVLEGDYNQIIQPVKNIQLKCLENGASDTIRNLKIQRWRDSDVTIEDKIRTSSLVQSRYLQNEREWQIRLN